MLRMNTYDDDDCMIKLDSNVEIDTLVRNRFEEEGFNASDVTTSSDEDDTEMNIDFPVAGTSKELKDDDNTTSIGSDTSDNFASGLSDVSADSGDSMMTEPVAGVDTEEEVTEKEETSDSEKVLEHPLRQMNVKELIVICIDMSTDIGKTPFVIPEVFDYANGSRFRRYFEDEGSTKKVKQSQQPALTILKRVIGMFIYNKYFIDKRHKFALMALYDTAEWVCDFTDNPKQLIDALETLKELRDCSSCDMSSVISLLTEKYPFINSPNAGIVDCLFRVILVYGRSDCLTSFSVPKTRDVLKYPSFFLDILYFHEQESENNKCAEVYENLCSLDDYGKSYIFEVTRSVTNLHSCMGKLLCHPFQRALQKQSNFKLQDLVPPNPVEETTEEEKLAEKQES